VQCLTILPHTRHSVGTIQETVIRLTSLFSALLVVTLAGCDRHGRPRTSCVIEADYRSHAERDAEHRAATDADARAFDLTVLLAIHQHPALATSGDNLQKLLTGRKLAISDSLARLTRQVLIVPGKRGQPYRLTEAGHAALSGGQS